MDNPWFVLIPAISDVTIKMPRDPTCNLTLISLIIPDGGQLISVHVSVKILKNQACERLETPLKGFYYSL